MQDQRERLALAMKRARAQWREEGLALGREQGLAEGRAEGRAAARKEGLVEGQKQLLIVQCRKRYGQQCADALAGQLEPVDSLAQLSELSRRLITSESPDDFLDHMRAA